jgi:hypothetical protein
MIERQADTIAELPEERGRLAERVAGLERQLLDIPRLSDDERQRLTADLETARTTLDASGPATWPSWSARTAACQNGWR